MRLAKSALQSLLVNRFAILNIEEVNTDIHEPIDAPLPSTLDRKALPQRLKWEKRLSRQLSANTLDAHRTSIILLIEISTTNTSVRGPLTRHSGARSSLLERPRSRSNITT